MKQRKSFLVYYDWENFLEPMTKEQIGELLLAMFDYNKNGVVPEFENTYLTGIFGFMKSRFDDDNEKYIKVCERNSEIATKRWEKEKQSKNETLGATSEGQNGNKTEGNSDEQDEILKNLRGNPPKLA